MRQEHVEVAVEIVIAEARRHGARREHVDDVRRIRRDVFERAVAAVRIDLVRVVVNAADEQVEIAVAVHVGEGRPAMPVIATIGTSIRDASLCGEVFEDEAFALLGELIQIEPVRPTAAVGPAGVAVGNEQVDVAVAIAIAGRGAADRHRRQLPNQCAFEIAADQRRLRVTDSIRNVRRRGHVDERRLGHGRRVSRRRLRCRGRRIGARGRAGACVLPGHAVAPAAFTRSET